MVKATTPTIKNNGQHGCVENYVIDMQYLADYVCYWNGWLCLRVAKTWLKYYYNQQAFRAGAWVVQLKPILSGKRKYYENYEDILSFSLNLRTWSSLHSHYGFIYMMMESSDPNNWIW